MNYRTLGRTGIRVSEVGMGSEGFVGKSAPEVLALVDAALAGGINVFDLYNPNPDVRTHLGAALAGRRERVVIQGHLCTVWEDGQYKRTRDLVQTKAAFGDLLERLRTDYVDIGMIHYIDEVADYDAVFGGEIAAYALQLKAEGRIRHIGISSHNPTVAAQAARSGLVDVIMFSVNPAYDLLPASEDVNILFADASWEQPLANIGPEREAFYRLCESEGVSITVMKPFAGGALLNEALSPLATALTPLQCIHYALGRPGVATVLAGCHDLVQLRDCLAYSDAGTAERDYSAVLARSPKHTFSGKCMYCGHCAPCAASIDVATVNKHLDLAIAQGSVPETVREHYAALGHHAGECLACGQCEPNCPFGVGIIAKMAHAKQVFGK